MYILFTKLHYLGQVVIGLDHVIITMKKGDIAVFMLSPRLGYRAIGKNGVPSNYVIQFKVDLISRITEANVCMDGGIIKKVLEKGEQIGPLLSKFPPKVSLAPLGEEKVEYFTLADLWNSFDEWSAYGAYVPYLFAIQIFTSNSSANSLRVPFMDKGLGN
ncbi:unnamed protein product [Camellia sinensis]